MINIIKKGFFSFMAIAAILTACEFPSYAIPNFLPSNSESQSSSSEIPEEDILQITPEIELTSPKRYFYDKRGPWEKEESRSRIPLGLPGDGETRDITKDIKQPFFQNEYCYMLASIIAKAKAKATPDFFRTHITTFGDNNYLVTLRNRQVVVDGTFRYKTKGDFNLSLNLLKNKFNPNTEVFAISNGPFWVEVYVRALITDLAYGRTDIDRTRPVSYKEFSSKSNAYTIFYLMGLTPEATPIAGLDLKGVNYVTRSIIACLDQNYPVCFGTKLTSIINLYTPGHQYAILSYRRPADKPNTIDPNEVTFICQDPHRPNDIFEAKASEIYNVSAVVDWGCEKIVKFDESASSSSAATDERSNSSEYQGTASLSEFELIAPANKESASSSSAKN